MRNLFRVLLVSSALVAVSAPSAFATPQQEADAATAGNFELLATVIVEPTLANLNAAVAECNGNKLCVINLLTAYGQLGVVPTNAQLGDIADAGGVTFTTAELSQYSIGAVGTTPAGTTTTTTLPGTGDQTASGSGAATIISTGSPTSPN